MEIDMDKFDELVNKDDYTKEDLEKILEFCENINKQIEEEKKNSKIFFNERITKQLAQERADYMKRWNAMTKEEQMAEMDRKNKVTEELARKSGAKLYDVKVKEDALSQIGLTDEIADKSKENK